MQCRKNTPTLLNMQLLKYNKPSFCNFPLFVTGYWLGTNRKTRVWNSVQPSIFGWPSFLFSDGLSAFFRHWICAWWRSYVPYATTTTIAWRARQILLGGNLPGSQLPAWERYYINLPNHHSTVKCNRLELNREVYTLTIHYFFVTLAYIWFDQKIGRPSFKK